MQTLHPLKEVAQAWGVCEATVVRQVDKGLLKGFRIGSDWRFSDEQLNEFLEQREINKSKKKKTA